MSCPAMVIVPLVGSSRPATIRRVVVLPQPDGPRSAKNRPCSTTRSRSSTAVNLAERLGDGRQRQVGAGVVRPAACLASRHGQAPITAANCFSYCCSVFWSSP